MKKLSEFSLILGQHFNWNKSRLTCFVSLLLSLFKVRTVNLSELAIGFSSTAKVESRYKRIQRFFRYFNFDYDAIGVWLFRLFFNPDSRVYLTIDRTNWFLGASKINVLVLGVAFEGSSIPLFWTLLNKAGNATAREHQAMIELFIKCLGKSCIAGVLGDREFASGELFGWLNKQGIPFYIRLKEGSMVRIKGKSIYSAQSLFSSLNPKQHKSFGLMVEIYGQDVYLAGSRSEKGELMIVATNQTPKNAIAIYLRRWEIETLFSNLKERGFRFEDTHLTKPERIEKLIVLLAVGFAWAHKTGLWQDTIKPIRWSKHPDGKRPQISFFRYGFDFIRDILINPFSKSKLFSYSISLLNLPEINQNSSPEIVC